MSLKPPQGPFAELGFFFAHLNDGESLLRTVDCLLTLGGRLTGTVFGHSGNEAREQFAGPLDYELIPRRISTSSDIVASEKFRVVEVEIADLTEYDRDSFARVTFGRVPEGADQSHHPVQVWLSGDLIDEYASEPSFALGRRAGREVAELFSKVLEVVDPSYATLTIERSIPTPHEIRTDPASKLEFPDFYLSEDFAETSMLTEILSTLGGCAQGLRFGIVAVTSHCFGAARNCDQRRAADLFARSLLNSKI